MYNILDTNIEQLKQDQLRALKEHISNVFNDILAKIKEGKYQEVVDKYLEYSPAGDDMGWDNYFINFSWNDDIKDISVVLSMLAELDDKKIKIGRY